MKVLEHGNSNEITDYIVAAAFSVPLFANKIAIFQNNITNCVETAKKLLVVLNKQRDNLKESVFKYMVKEVRYELLELLENMVKKTNINTKKTKDGNVLQDTVSKREMHIFFYQMSKEMFLWCVVKP